MKKTGSYDFYLILATVAVLFVISAICVYGMFSFKFAQIQNMPVAIKATYMERMNTILIPFLIALIVILGICIPKRLMPTVWLNRFAVLLGILLAGVVWWIDLKTGLTVILTLSLLLQTVVLILALAGSARLIFEKKGYWLRVGSSLIHLGLILFILDLLFYKNLKLHLLLFWITTLATVAGMLLCFYAEWVAGVFDRTKACNNREEDKEASIEQ
ncbi:MAG: hypothetical protein A2511_15775 [Deltaproteobacteria bacterium RIFOXYD12_FULL_50_9]|nr:MAG: hypothetical protein A2511_15775 [Deltaproteobacteria bacterium RIFOXYD12_FULL_50_9]